MCILYIPANPNDLVFAVAGRLWPCLAEEAVTPVFAVRGRVGSPGHEGRDRSSRFEEHLETRRIR